MVDNEQVGAGTKSPSCSPHNTVSNTVSLFCLNLIYLIMYSVLKKAMAKLRKKIGDLFYY